jgi:hypothetical protein
MSWLQNWSLDVSIVAGVAAAALILLNDRRLALLVLAGQYGCLGVLAGLSLPLPVAATKLLAGWVAVAILALTAASTGWKGPAQEGGALPSGLVFRLAAVLLVATVAAGLAKSGLFSLPNVAEPEALAATLLIGLGLLQTGLSEEPLRFGLGLLTMLGGYEAAYSVVEPSLAVAAMLAAVHVGVALAVAYLLVVSPRQPADDGRQGG